MLRLSNVRTRYGKVVALRDVSLYVPDGNVVAVLGAKGAGKSTLLLTISGIVHPDAGTIEYDGYQIDDYGPSRVVKLGVVQVPQGRQLCAHLTVLDNLRLGALTRRDSAGVKRDIERTYDLFPALGRRRLQTAGRLSIEDQQVLALARALVARPRLLMLDEPSLGFAPSLLDETFRRIRQVADEERLTVIVAESQARPALGIADYAYVLESGGVAVSDEAVRLRDNADAWRSYLGC